MRFPTSESLPWDLIERYARQYSIDPNLVGALIQQESGGNAQIAEFCSINYGVSFTVIGTLTGVTGLNVQTLYDNGEIIT